MMDRRRPGSGCVCDEVAAGGCPVIDAATIDCGRAVAGFEQAEGEACGEGVARVLAVDDDAIGGEEIRAVAGLEVDVGDVEVNGTRDVAAIEGGRRPCVDEDGARGLCGVEDLPDFGGVEISLRDVGLAADDGGKKGGEQGGSGDLTFLVHGQK